MSNDDLLKTPSLTWSEMLKEDYIYLDDPIYENHLERERKKRERLRKEFEDSLDDL